MKKTYLLLCLLANVFYGELYAQKWSDYKAIAESNFRLLNKDQRFSGSVVFGVNGLTLYNVDKEGNRTQGELTVPWESVPKLVNKLERTKPYEIAKASEWSNALLQGVSTYSNHKPYKSIPVDIKNLVIAIDPGHFAASFEEAATMEQKYVKVRGAEVGKTKDIKFYEAELTDLTALILEAKLLEVGAKPFLTKEKGRTSLDVSFSYWYKNGYKKDLYRALNEKIIDRATFELIEKGDSITVYEKFFKYLEFTMRVDKINDVSPDATICIHYNANETNKRDAQGFLKPVQENYSMAFVPGSFLRNELSRPSEKVDFLRLLFSNDLDKSVRLANLILEKERNIAGISEVPSQNVAIDERYCTPTAYEGVFARNLAMTRMVHGPIVYLEALLQDNDREIINLSQKDYEFVHPKYGKLTAPKRCEQIAESIYQGLIDWIEENKIMASLK
jgi:N-acetylmuramoyl-L-alanine amidase